MSDPSASKFRASCFSASRAASFSTCARALATAAARSSPAARRRARAAAAPPRFLSPHALRRLLGLAVEMGSGCVWRA